ncbi:MAG: DUF6328 family protein [Lapillicoccus sp.]
MSAEKARPRDRQSASDPDGTERDETATERADRNWDELLQELRVTQSGIQIRSGFPLTLPFQQCFITLDNPMRPVPGPGCARDVLDRAGRRAGVRLRAG